jgi:serine/threonine-protein kinase
MPDRTATDPLAPLTARYTIERELGRGGMGTVYLARDRTLDRPVALKVLPPEIATNTALRDRFARETKVAASFSHPNIVPVYGVEQHEGLLAYAMGYIDGESLGARVARMGPLAVRDVVKLLQDVCYALAYAHGRDIVHRDLKPDNIMIERATGRALLMDFGIARTITAAPAGRTSALTRIGEVVGTPEYMSPEQASGDTVDGRSDLYALGLVAYFALTGAPVITGDSTQQLIVRQLTETPPPLATLRADVPSALAAVVEQCVRKEPAERFVDAAAVLDALDRAQVSGPKIPLAVRMYVQDVATMAVILFFGGLLILTQGAAVLDRTLRLGFINHADGFIPLVVLFAVLSTRALQIVGNGRRLRQMGFTRDDVLSAVRATRNERNELRTQNAANPDVLARRRTTVRTALFMLVLGGVLLAIAWSTRTQLSPTSYYTPPHGLVALFSALGCLGSGFALLMMSPLREPLAERAQVALWTGPIGRAFLRVAMGRDAERDAGSTGATRVAVGAGVANARGRTSRTVAAVPRTLPSAGSLPDNASARLDAIETRLTALEGRQSPRA